jgi:hypothetical protein
MTFPDEPYRLIFMRDSEIFRDSEISQRARHNVCDSRRLERAARKPSHQIGAAHFSTARSPCLNPCGVMAR